MHIPLGLMAITVVALFVRIPRRARSEKPRVDYFGMALIATVTMTVVLVVLVGTSGGSEYD